MTTLELRSVSSETNADTHTSTVPWGKHRGRPTAAHSMIRPEQRMFEIIRSWASENTKYLCALPTKSHVPILQCMAHTAKRMMNENRSPNAYLLGRQRHHTVEWTDSLIHRTHKNKSASHGFEKLKQRFWVLTRKGTPSQRCLSNS